MSDIVERLRQGWRIELSDEELCEAADCIEAQAKRIEQLEEALRKCLPVMRKSHDRIHCLPRTSDTELAEAIDIALGVARTALGEKE